MTKADGALAGRAQQRQAGADDGDRRDGEVQAPDRGRGTRRRPRSAWWRSSTSLDHARRRRAPSPELVGVGLVELACGARWRRSAAIQSGPWSTAASWSTTAGRRGCSVCEVGERRSASLRRAAARSRPVGRSRSMWPVLVEELGGDVGDLVDVDTRARPSVGRNTARWRPVSSTASRCTPVRRAGERAEQLADQRVALDAADAGDHGQRRVQVEGEGGSVTASMTSRS